LIDWLRVSCSPKNDAIYFWRTTAHRLRCRDHIGTELGVPIEDQEALRLLAAFPSFVQLQLDPKGVGITSHVVMKDPAKQRVIRDILAEPGKILLENLQ
jgi:hypothetical protein